MMTKWCACVCSCQLSRILPVWNGCSWDFLFQGSRTSLTRCKYSCEGLRRRGKRCRYQNVGLFSTSWEGIDRVMNDATWITENTGNTKIPKINCPSFPGSRPGSGWRERQWPTGGSARWSRLAGRRASGDDDVDEDEDEDDVDGDGED